MSNLDNPSVQRVRAALAEASSPAEVIELSATARSAQDAADSVGTELGSIVKSLVFAIAGSPVMALVAGDRQCDTKALAAALGHAGKAKRADADLVREATGFAIGGVPPVAHETKLPVVIDASLARFETVYAAAGHPYCVFATSITELARLTGGDVREDIGTAG
jgi:prolyl-tRNA editing enzyme YbaK/EbsC (Cys-tRNA(Pro) deacylase)